ncbi:hypothetical protein [Sediminibacterium ginsengisoli]|uniref:Sigma 54 modulation protein / S30EA ribosomal protein n=1 Tax=Sediminibacterium ginsengisoli TaxID=413434 RepID=A0A1T4Q0J8_9BACT|nr:hypothetical protein [Sediminibacterium ginsengisoli]SJZ97315.1 hypothetical protein SAMN04488132_10776 [Sediminibacterium ginsengisoli]
MQLQFTLPQQLINTTAAFSLLSSFVERMKELASETGLAIASMQLDEVRSNGESLKKAKFNVVLPDGSPMHIAAFAHRWEDAILNAIDTCAQQVTYSGK